MPLRPRRRSARLALLVPVVLVVAACVPLYTGGPPGAPRMAIISDSVLGMARDQIGNELRLDHSINFFVQNGVEVSGAQSIATDVAATDPDNVVISLGTDDGFDGVQASQTIDQLKAMVAKFPRSCVSIVTLNSHTVNGYAAAHARLVNSWIRSRTQVIDWDGWVSSYEAAGEPSGPITYDTIHVNPTGQAFLAGVATYGARQCLNRGNPFGSVDGVSSPQPGLARVTGWAIDADTTAPIDVHLYVDGVGAVAGTANRNRPDVGNAYPRWGAMHGYDLTVVGLSPGPHAFCAYGIDVGPGGNSLLACTSAVVT